MGCGLRSTAIFVKALARMLIALRTLIDILKYTNAMIMANPHRTAPWVAVEEAPPMSCS